VRKIVPGEIKLILQYRPAMMLVITVCALFLALPLKVTAQENSNSSDVADETTEPTAKSGPEEIVVTARKREENLQEVPISITAFTADQLRESGAVNNYDVALLTVNFNTLQQTGRRQDRPVIRGMTAPANRGEANASYFIDGAFVSGSISTASLGPV
jgi:iron complex outermembrane receptor protein